MTHPPAWDRMERLRVLEVIGAVLEHAASNGAVAACLDLPDLALLGNPDMISSLPDDILINILSLMTVREAAVTDVLSTRWRHLWESVDHFILDMHTFGMQVPPNSDNHGNLDFWNSEATKFVGKVNELLSHHKGNKLKEFKVEFPLSSAHASELDRWVAFAVASHAETLTLSLCDEHGRVATDHTEAYVFPLKQFSDVGGCQLHVLSLCKCILETVPANLNGFSYLYSLSLCHVRMVDEVLLSIMSSCNALHNLYLRACHKLIDLRASRAQLVNLEVHWCQRLRSISIHAEKMESFSYTSRRADIEFECAPVLCELTACFRGMWHHTLALLDKFPNKLKMLTLPCSSRLQASRVLKHNGRFAVLKEITWFMATCDHRRC
ncbi:F-box protein At5g03100-like isoform X2 [Miscanthus floridulus]|uniref:F-box protein At5g03100-like isoform X2 n=1 Tax=Miscanthus floridulus TaxID=154761 RepID=UPI0034590334